MIPSAPNFYIIGPDGKIINTISYAEVIAALGFIPVPTTRTLTINGVAYDLSADRSWTVTTGGGGTVTSVGLTSSDVTIGGASPITGAGTFTISLINSKITGQLLTGYVSGAGTISATDSILLAIQKLNGNIAAIGAIGLPAVLGNDPHTNEIPIISNDASSSFAILNGGKIIALTTFFGINTSSPAAPLDVNGNVYIRAGGALKVDEIDKADQGHAQEHDRKVCHAENNPHEHWPDRHPKVAHGRCDAHGRPSGGSCKVNGIGHQAGHEKSVSSPCNHCNHDEHRKGF